MQLFFTLSLLLALWLWRNAEGTQHYALVADKLIRRKHLDVQSAQNSRFCD